MMIIINYKNLLLPGISTKDTPFYVPTKSQFHNDASVKPEWVKKKDTDLYFSLDDFYSFKLFSDKLSESTKYNWRYSIVPRMSYINFKNGEFKEWKSLGEQIGFFYEAELEYNNSVKHLHTTLISRLNYLLEMYNIPVWCVTGIQFIINKVEYSSSIQQNKLTKETIGENKDLLNYSKISEGYNKLLPLTMDVNKFGARLNKNVVNNNVESIILIDGSTINLIERINKYLDVNKTRVQFEGDIQIFQKSLKDLDIIIIVKKLDGYNDINIYNLNGMKLLHATDVKLNIKNHFTRSIGNVVAYINETGIYNKEISTKFNPVQPRKAMGLQASMLFKDWRVGTLDLEAYNDSNNISRAYSIGFYTDNNIKTFYIGEDLNSDTLIINCLEAMLVEKYHRYTFYVHNFSKYDVCFILPVIIRANELTPNKFEYNLTLRDDLIIAMEVSTKIKNKKYTIKLVDSLNLLQSSLDSLCKTFKTDVKKTIFPYDFVNRNNLFFVGAKPDICFYNLELDYSTNASSDLKLDDKIVKLEKDLITLSIAIDKFTYYYKTPHFGWSLKDQTIKYLEHDLISLFSVMEKFQYNIFKEYHAQVTQSLTISSLAMNIYLKRFYNNHCIPLIGKDSIYNNIRKSYYGGITEVYKPQGKNLYYYDVNSLYPYSALNSMPGLNCVYIDVINKNISECIDNLFGFYYCKIETSDKYIGLIPVRTEDGIKMPLGFIEGWYFSEELKFAFKHGYKIEIIKGYKFDKTENVFKDYVEEFYKIKSTTKDSVMKSIAKSLLNNFLGKWGLNLDKFVTEIVSKDELKNILQIKKVKSLKYIGDKVLVTRSSEICPSVCKSHNVDYIKACKNEITQQIERKVFKNSKFHDVSIAIAAAITSYSRIYINQVKLDILDKGGDIYYSDTDSIITNIKLDDSKIGAEIGKFKLEHEISEGYFIGCKTYGFKNSKGEIIMKTKGGSSGFLSFDDLEKLYSGLNIDTTRYETIRNYSVGSVRIKVPNIITLSANMYNKRVKVFRNEKWIDTKPLYQHSSKIHTTNEGNTYNWDIYKIYYVLKLFVLPKILLILILILIWIVLVLIITYVQYDRLLTESCLESLDMVPDLTTKCSEIINNNTVNTDVDDTVYKNPVKKILHSFSNRQLDFTSNNEFVHKLGGNTPKLTNDMDKQVISKSKILLELCKDDFEAKDLTIEVANLKEEISLLMVQNLQNKVSMLDTTNILESVIKDLETEIIAMQTPSF